MIKAVVLAGGSGTRLWPLSRKHVPKQYLSVDGGEVMLKATVDRLVPFIRGDDDVLIVTNELHASGEAYQVLSGYEKILEPVGRNTAPAIAISAAWLLRQNTDSVMVVLPADHVIRNRVAFHDVLGKAIHHAKQGELVTFGIEPTHPDTGFGYIKSFCNDNSSTIKVEKFLEKPNLVTAKQLLSEGGYYWNSGMFVWKASVIMKLIAKYLPDVNSVIEKIKCAWDEENSDNPQLAIDTYFHEMPDISIDVGILEKVPNDEGMVVIPSDIDWSDVGSWDAVYDILPKDKSNNALYGEALALDCSNILIHSNKRLVAAVGVKDLCVVETSDAILIVNRGESQRVRDVVSALKDRNAQEYVLHPTVRRPWGSYTVLEEQLGFKMKRITVEPGHSLSLQRHQHRSEHWIVVSGTATVVCDGDTRVVTKNQSTYIPIGSTHRLENRGKIILQLIEVQVGEYLGEDDIERFEDDYGRRKSDLE